MIDTSKVNILILHLMTFTLIEGCRRATKPNLSTNYPTKFLINLETSMLLRLIDRTRELPAHFISPNQCPTVRALLRWFQLQHAIFITGSTCSFPLKLKKQTNSISCVWYKKKGFSGTQKESLVIQKMMKDFAQLFDIQGHNNLSRGNE